MKCFFVVGHQSGPRLGYNWYEMHPYGSVVSEKSRAGDRRNYLSPTIRIGRLENFDFVFFVHYNW